MHLGQRGSASSVVARSRSILSAVGWTSVRRCSVVLVAVLSLAVPGEAGAATGSGSLRQFSFDWQQLSDRIQVGVNIGTGNLLTEEHDVAVSGALGPGLTLARFSNSQTDVARAFGMDMSMDAGADVKLAVQGSGDVDYTGASAFTVRFTRRADGSFATPSGLDATLVRQGDGSYVLTEHQSQLARSFTSAGRLTQVEDRNGRKLTYEYNADGTLATITDGPESSGDITRRVTVGYDGSRRVNLVTDPAGRQHRYAYDAAGYLSTYTNPDAKVTRYRTDGGRLAVITTPAGRVTKISYYPAGDPNAGRVASVMRVTNPTAAESSWSGPTTRYAYSFVADGSGTVDVTDPRGGVWTYTVDAQGRVTRTEAPTTDGKRLVSTQTWSSTSKVNQYSAPGTATSPSSTTFAYDSNDNPSGSTTPAGAGTLYSGARYGEGTTAPGGQYLPTTVYDEQDYAGTSGSSVGGSNPTTWTGLEYSAQGNLKVAKRNATITPSVSIAYASEVKGSSGAGRITSTTDPRGAVTSYSYDGAGNLTRVTYPAPGTGTAMGDTVFDYAATTADRALNRLSSATDGKLQKRTYTYDALDRTTQIRWVNSAGSVTEDVFFVFDADGNMIERRDSTGTTTYQYDQLGRVTHIDAPGPGFVDPDYDASSNLTSLTDESGTVTYAYKPNNRLASIAEPGGSCSTSPTTLCTTYSYDDSGPGGTTLPAGIARTVTQRLPSGLTTTEQIDAGGRLVRTDSTLGSTLVQRFVYQYQHANGREMMLRSQETDYTGSRRKYTYDALDRLRRIEYLSSSGTVTNWVEYRWDAASNRTLVDRKSTCGKFYDRIGYNYNALNQLVSMGAPGNGSENCAYGTSGSWTYDANGNEIQHCTEGSGGAARSATTSRRSAGATTSTAECLPASTYNLRNQLTSSSRIYAGVGQSEIVSEGGTAFTNSFLGILSQGGTTYFTRTDAGRLVSQRNQASTAPNRRQYYLLDALATIRTVVDENGAVVSRSNPGPFGDGGSGGTFGFASGRNTGELIHFGERYYDPFYARWTQPDPINQFADIRQANRYAYVGGDPVNNADPDGRFLCLIVKDCRERVYKPAARAVSNFARRKFTPTCYVYKSFIQKGDSESVEDAVVDLVKCTPPGFVFDQAD